MEIIFQNKKAWQCWGSICYMPSMQKQVLESLEKELLLCRQGFVYRDSSFKYGWNVWDVLDVERCIHSMEFAMTSKTQLTFNHPKTCGKKLGQWDCVHIWQLASNKRPSARNKKGYSLHCWIRTVRKKSTSNKKTQIFIHNSKAMEDIQKTDEQTRKSTLLKTTSIITVSWRICISIRFVVEHIQWKMQNAICSMCNDEPGERGQQENQFCGAS